MEPDKIALCAELDSARFLSGEDKGQWRFRDLQWPHLYVSIVARDGCSFTLRLNCAGYPSVPPTGTFWDMEKNAKLDFGKWPKGGERISHAFKPDWKNGDALYIPCDRESIVGHDGWIAQYPQMIWNPARGIILYLAVVHDILQSSYCVCAAA